MRSIVSDSLLEGKTCVWIYNIEDEQRWGRQKTIPSVADPHQSALVAQQEQQQLFLADQNDLVWLRKELDPRFAHYLQDRGFALPSIVHRPEQLPADVPDRTLMPYLASEEIAHFAREQNIGQLLCPDLALIKKLNDKHFTRKLLAEHQFRVTEGRICDNLPELADAYRRISEQGFARAVVKVPHGSSGKGLFHIESADAFQHYTHYLQRRGEGEPVLIEGWYDVERNLNSQLWIGDSRVELLKVTEQVTDRSGVYLGTDYTPEYAPALVAHYADDMLRLGQLLQKLGYRGIAGVDSIVTADGTLFPAVEINARFTQVTYLLPVVQRYASRFRCVESRYIKAQSPTPIDFEALLALLRQTIRPDEQLDFLLYTYAEHEVNGTYAYRLFLLLAADGKDRLQASIARLADVQRLIASP